jgi:hypothetical protein
MDRLNKYIVNKVITQSDFSPYSIFVEDKKIIKDIFDDNSNPHLICAILCGMVYNWTIQEDLVYNIGLNPDNFETFPMNNRKIVFSTYFKDDVLILTFKGSSNIKDFLADINLLHVDHHSGKVHKGFLDLLTDNDTHLEILEIIKKFNAKRMYITGHSLGAALATLLYSYGIDTPATLVTFGCPRVGDSVFAKSISNSVRYVNENDAVTKLPLPLNYRHTDIKILLGDECALKYNISDHSIDKYISKLEK